MENPPSPPDVEDPQPPVASGSPIDGTWRIDSGMFTATYPNGSVAKAPYIEGSALASEFEIKVCKHPDYSYMDGYEMQFSGEGVAMGYMVWMKFDTGSGGSGYNVPISGAGNYEKISEHYYYQDAYDPTLPGLMPGSGQSYTLIDDSTLQYKNVAIDDESMVAELVVILKRVR